MRAKKMAPDTVPQVQAEIADWQAKRERCAADLAAAQAVAEDAGTMRQLVLLAAKAEGNAEAVTALDEATIRQEHADREAKDLTIVLTQIDAKLERLAQAYQTAARTEAVEQLRAMTEERLAVDAPIERLLTELVPLLRRWVQLSNDMAIVADTWGFPNAEAYGRRYTLAAFIGWQLKPLNLTTPLHADNRTSELLEPDRAALSDLLGRLEGSDPVADKAAA